MRRSLDKTSESGFTLVETLVMLAVTALIATLVIPLSSQGVRDNFRLADRILLSGEQAASETEYRRLLRQAVPPLLRPDGSIEEASLVGLPTALRFPVESEQARTCVGLAGYTVVRLRVEEKARGGKLVCDGASSSHLLLVWERGEARFSYSRDGVNWLDSWPPRRRRDMQETDGPPFVRMSLRHGGNTRLLWIERAGDPSLNDPRSESGEDGPLRWRRLW